MKSMLIGLDLVIGIVMVGSALLYFGVMTAQRQGVIAMRLNGMNGSLGREIGMQESIYLLDAMGLSPGKPYGTYALNSTAGSRIIGGNGPLYRIGEDG